MIKKLSASLATVLLVTGCGVDIPQGYRPSQSTVPNASITEISVDQRTEPIEISGPGLSGGKITTEDMSGIVVVNAWASWCPPCREEWPIFAEIQSEFPDINILGLNEADDKAAALEFLNSQEGSWPHISDPNQAIAAQADVIQGSYLPGTIVLDKQRRVAAKFIGPVNKSDLKRIIQELLAE
ncbi:MAG: TlpA family protein disulfide reductase [Candidatus Nanopelagicales bacterium]|nr:TlpA family protein disulfide reductase [Candidatus Nanopelagicales bacterium]